MTKGTDYWLASWLDEHGIRNVHGARRFLKEPKHVKDLRTAASGAPTTLEPLDGAEQTTLVAGKTIDLSGDLSCCHPECLEKAVDRLFARAWYYFDIIVVEGLTPASILSMIDERGDDFPDRFLGYVENFLHVRKIGAETMLAYRQKPPPCTVHLQQHAEEHAVSGILEERSSWVRSFASGAKIKSLYQHEDHWHYLVAPPVVDHVVVGIVRNGTRGKKPTKSQVYGSVFDRYAANLISDISAARAMRSPLGAAASIHEGLLSGNPASSPTVQDALFELDLPVVSGVSAENLIKIRQENWQYFDAFRLALQSAARDLIANSDDAASSADIARQIKNDVIEPELVRIRREMRISADILTKKSVVSLPVGALATTIGLLDKFPLAAMGAAAVVTAGGIGSFILDYKNYVEGKRAVLMSDMYFLWNAQRITGKKH